MGFSGTNMRDLGQKYGEWLETLIIYLLLRLKKSDFSVTVLKLSHLKTVVGK